MSVSMFVPGLAEVGEGPFWSADDRSVTWVDLIKGEVRVSSIESQHTVVHTLPMTVGAAVPVTGSSELAVAVADGFGYLRSGVLDLTEPFLLDPQLRMNDAKCDSRGRLWAGSTALDFQAGRGALHVWDALVVRTVATGFSLPNGLGWSPDDSTMYLVDSTKHLLLRANFDLARGEVGSFETLAVVPDGLPDGLAVAADGSIWVAVWGGSKVCRFSAEGKLLQSFPVPVSQPSSCAFGDDGHLLVTTARDRLTPAELRDQPLAGSILTFPTDVSGVPVRGFLRP